jgi:uncharacterized protein YbjT (DUF2867 family)
MRIFLTGATGYIGAAVLDALVRGGHDVTALVATTRRRGRVAKRGAHPVVGNLADPESFRASADGQDGYVHAAYDSPSAAGRRSSRRRSKRSSRRRRRPRTAGATRRRSAS